jgi:hypothetical protein
MPGEAECHEGDKEMKSIQGFDHALCCSTGVCGVDHLLEPAGQLLMEA